RFACSVCPQRPVCDTLEALAVHRAGRRHLHSLQRFYGRNRSLPAPEAPGEAPGVQVGVASPAPPMGPLPMAPPEPHPFHSQGSQAPLLARTRRITHSALLKSTPYSSCCRRKGAQGSSSRAGTTRTVPEPLRNVGESRECRALLLEHGSGRAGGSQGAPPGQDPGSSRVSPVPEGPTPALFPLQTSGWIQDPCGKWVKDGNAEFDSDEDEPPALPPT
ncbi:SCNM1 protein, partial [Pachyramphus minor]|nr:SCNM1 protein [Pachyramphus minor]